MVVEACELGGGSTGHAARGLVSLVCRFWVC